MQFSLKQLITGRRLPLTLVILLAAGVMVALGFWQLQRLAGRRAQNAHIRERMNQPALRITGPVADPAALEYRPVTLVGTFDYDHEVTLRNTTHDGAPGVDLLTPLRISGSNQAVLVDRGWIPYLEREPDARKGYRVAGNVVIHGRARLPQVRTSSLVPADPALSPTMPRVDAWLRVDVPRIQQQTPYPLLPMFVQALPDPGGPALPWREPTIELDEGPHLSYAIQWFAFATILLAGYVARAARTDEAPRPEPLATESSQQA